MAAFEVHLNGKKLCIAGIGDDGVLVAIVSYVVRSSRKEELSLSVSGLVSPAQEHVRWRDDLELEVGDEVLLRIVESERVDRPRKRTREDPTARVKQQKHYVRAMAKKFGWEIKARPKKSK